MNSSGMSDQNKIEMIDELYRRGLRQIIWIYAAACILVLAAGAYATMIME